MDSKTEILCGQQPAGTTATPPSAWLPLGLTVSAGVLRLLAPVPNLTPVGALGLYAGGRLRSWQAFALPLLVMAATDGKGVNVILEMAAHVNLDKDLTILAQGGRVGGAELACGPVGNRAYGVEIQPDIRALVWRRHRYSGSCERDRSACSRPHASAAPPVRPVAAPPGSGSRSPYR